MVNNNLFLKNIHLIDEELKDENVISASSLHVPTPKHISTPEKLKPIKIPKKRAYKIAATGVNKDNTFIYKVIEDEIHIDNVNSTKEDNCDHNEIINTDMDYKLSSPAAIIVEEIVNEQTDDYIALNENYNVSTSQSDWVELNDIETIEISSRPIMTIDDESNNTSGVSTLTTLVPATSNSTISSLIEDNKTENNIVLDKSNTSNNNSANSIQSSIIYQESTVVDPVQDNVHESINVLESNQQYSELETNSVVDEVSNNDTNEWNIVGVNNGDILWAQIYNYCYWPCMVHPDPDTNVYIKDDKNRFGQHYTAVHVRFLADRGSRNWVKWSNIMPFRGYENYIEILEEIKRIHGIHSAKFKSYIPVKYKQRIWFLAISEAEFLSNFNFSDRFAHFNYLQTISK